MPDHVCHILNSHEAEKTSFECSDLTIRCAVTSPWIDSFVLKTIPQFDNLQSFTCLGYVENGTFRLSLLLGVKLSSILEALLPLAGRLHTLRCLTGSGLNKLRDTSYNRLSALTLLPKMYPRHLCHLLRRFTKLRNLDVPMSLCKELFADSGSDMLNAPCERNWTIRALSRKGLCRSPWYQDSGEELLQSCRDWRNRYEEATHEIAAWNVTIHVLVLRRPCYRRRSRSYHYDVVSYLPLQRPPMAVMCQCIDSYGIIKHHKGEYEENLIWEDSKKG